MDRPWRGRPTGRPRPTPAPGPEERERYFSVRDCETGILLRRLTVSVSVTGTCRLLRSPFGSLGEAWLDRSPG